jgi:hypothetical protein
VLNTAKINSFPYTILCYPKMQEDGIINTDIFVTEAFDNTPTLQERNGMVGELYSNSNIIVSKLNYKHKYLMHIKLGVYLAGGRKKKKTKRITLKVKKGWEHVSCHSLR